MMRRPAGRSHGAPLRSRDRRLVTISRSEGRRRVSPSYSHVFYAFVFRLRVFMPFRRRPRFAFGAVEGLGLESRPRR